MLLLVADLTMRLPFTVADYVDFYASEHHRAGPRRRLVHLPVDGASLRADDLYASGTVSGADDNERA